MQHDVRSAIPFCAVCGKAVEEVLQFESMRGDMVFRAKCHGDTEDTVIGLGDMQLGPLILIAGVAFRRNLMST